jgi:hypothetical protein
MVGQITVDRCALVRRNRVNIGKSTPGWKGSCGDLGIDVFVGTRWEEGCSYGCEEWASGRKVGAENFAGGSAVSVLA